MPRGDLRWRVLPVLVLGDGGGLQLDGLLELGDLGLQCLHLLLEPRFIVFHSGRLVPTGLRRLMIIADLERLEVQLQRGLLDLLLQLLFL